MLSKEFLVKVEVVDDMKNEATIVGAGLVGTLLSIFLARRGYKVSVYERRSDMRTEVAEAGRSINLALSDRGIRALKTVGIADDILEIAIPMHGRQIHHIDGSQNFQPYGKDGQYINSVSRSELNCKLMDLAEHHGVQLHFNYRLQDVDWKNKTVLFASGDENVTINFNILFGADGAFAATRLAHMLQHDLFEYHQYYIDCGYKELSIPVGAEGRWPLEKHRLHIWPRKDYMLIALPNLDGSFTGTLFFPFAGEQSFEKLTTPEAVDRFFQQTFPDVTALIPDLQQQFFENPTSSLVTVKCFPWIREDYFCLIGDAAHAVVPFFGQGMNAGFEDCYVLDQLIEQYDEDWSAIFATFQQQRKPDADAIADLAVENFIEMSAKTAEPKFLLQKKIEARLHEHHPNLWIPAYSQVTFRPDIRYSEALSNAVLQEQIMQEIMKDPDIEKKWDSEELEKEILKRKEALKVKA